MTNKEMFIQEVEELIRAEQDIFSEGARAYFEQLKATTEKEKPPFTENGAKVLIWMQENYESYNNILKAKEIVITNFYYLNEGFDDIRFGDLTFGGKLKSIIALFVPKFRLQM